MRRLLLAAATMALAFPATAGATTFNATPSTFASVVSSAQSGDTILLASGSYGTWTGTNKAILVQADAGSTPSMGVSFDTGDSGFTLDGVTIDGGDIAGHDITIKNASVTSSMYVTGAGSTTNVLLDGLHFDWPVVSSGGINAKLTIDNATSAFSGVTVQNSTFKNGDLDGIRLAAGANVLNNEFADLCDIGTNHTDNIQYYPGGTGGRIAGNYFHVASSCDTQGITSYDGGTNGIVIEDNVIDIRRPWGIELYADKNSIVRHNTIRWYDSGNCDFNIPCGNIAVTHKTADPRSDGTQVYDNIAAVDMSDTTNGRADHNVQGSGVTYVGPLTTWAGFQLAAGSLGKGAADDGLDDGIRVGTPPPPPPPPPTDHQPTASFTASPEPSAPGQQVTFDGSASVCEDTPCTWRYSDDANNATLGTAQTSTFTFQNTGTKLVRLTVTDADGDTATVEHDHVVSSAPPPATQLLGRNSITSSVDDNNVAGQAQAYQYTATATGNALHIRVYINTGNTATKLTAGVYTGNSVPGSLRVQGSTTGLTVGQWADVTVPTTAITSGTKYWIAVLGTGGVLHYRDGNAGGTGLSYGSSQTNLTALPATWSNGPNWSGSYALSGYVTT